MIKEAIIKVAKKEDLPYEESKAVMNEIMDGETSQVQTAAYLTALAMKGETIDEITGSAEGMRSHALQLKHDMDVLEIVGTGGDGSNSFNISTTASLVIAAVHSRDDRTVNKEHDHHAGHVASGCCTCRCQNTQIQGFLSFLSWCAPFDCKAVNTPVTKLTLYIITKAIRGCKDFLNSFVKFL